MKTQYVLFGVSSAALLLLAGGAAATLALYEPALLWLAVTLWLLAALTVLLVIIRFRRRLTNHLRQLVHRLDPRDRENLSVFSVACVAGKRYRRDPVLQRFV